MGEVKQLKVGVVGATGMVGKVFLDLLQTRKFPTAEVRLFASEASAGKTVTFKDQEIKIQTLKENCFDGLDLVFFSSGDDISKEWAPKAAASGAFAIDNSAAFRTDSNTLLIVPEVNGEKLKGLKPQIIANPNCSTIQLVVALKPLYDNYGIEKIKVATYQAVSGAGQPAYDELIEQVSEYLACLKANIEIQPPVPRQFPHPIVFNCIPHIGSVNIETGHTSEEMKVISETKKIMGDQNIKVSAFTVRVPVLNAHAEAVWLTLKKDISRDELMGKMVLAKGVQVMDNFGSYKYPMQSIASGKDPVYVGRMHKDLEDPMTWMLWIVADNLRKGAALNGIQIAESIFDIK